MNKHARHREIYNYLDRYIDEELYPYSQEILDNLPYSDTVKIDGKTYDFFCWLDVSGYGEIVAVELNRKKFIISEAFTLGVILSEDSPRKLTQEELWDFGF